MDMRTEDARKARFFFVSAVWIEDWGWIQQKKNEQ